MSESIKVTGTNTPFAGLDRLSKFLGFHARRQQVIAGNMANIDTPGYRSRDITFKEELSSMRDAGGRSVGQMRFSEEVVVTDDETPDQDGNSVSLEKQMARTVSNQLRFSAINELLSRKLGMLKYAARDGS
jgi:flagellar basal-body rod protein FlgB